jgi:pyrroloquinoline quinone biosynthesis protein B
LLSGRPRTQAQVAVSANGFPWVLLNASPDLRQQLSEHPEFVPARGARSAQVIAIILTSADVDCVMGLLHLREFQPLRIFATSSVVRVLTEENTLFRVLDRARPRAQWETLPLDKEVPVLDKADSGVSMDCRAVPLGGQFPDYVGARLRKGLPREEAVIGLELSQGRKRLFYAPSLPGEAERWKCRVAESQAALLDGTFWSDQELIDVRGTGKTAREIGHLPLAGPNGLIDQLENLPGRSRRLLIHINNTNPILDEESPASHAVRQAGWEVAYDGMEFEL